MKGGEGSDPFMSSNTDKASEQVSLWSRSEPLIRTSHRWFWTVWVRTLPTVPAALSFSNDSEQSFSELHERVRSHSVQSPKVLLVLIPPDQSDPVKTAVLKSSEEKKLQFLAIIIKTCFWLKHHSRRLSSVQVSRVRIRSEPGQNQV